MSKPIRAALYARTSTADRGQDPELQLEELRRLADQRGWKVASEYVDICPIPPISRSSIPA